MALCFRLTTMGGVRGRLTFSLLTKRWQKKLCRNTRKKQDTGGAPMKVGGRDLLGGSYPLITPTLFYYCSCYDYLLNYCKGGTLITYCMVFQLSILPVLFVRDRKTRGSYSLGTQPDVLALTDSINSSVSLLSYSSVVQLLENQWFKRPLLYKQRNQTKSCFCLS